jgi:hypothetical protein
MTLFKKLIPFLLLFVSFNAKSQINWRNVDTVFQPLPPSVHVYFTDEKIDTSPFRAYYLVADLKDRALEFTVDTSKDRRLTPSKFYEKNNHPLAVVNCTFFSFETNRNLNAVIMNGELVAFNQHSIPGKGKDTFTYRHVFGSALGVSKKRTVDIAWLLADSGQKQAYAIQSPAAPVRDSVNHLQVKDGKVIVHETAGNKSTFTFEKWKMETAVGGGPVLLQNGEIKISNNEELRFAGKAINDKHPRTAMGYTADQQLIILVVEGRNPRAGGATLVQLARIFKDLKCVEALNLDGGGSSCLLINGKETIKTSDAAGQRAVPAVFMIRRK